MTKAIELLIDHASREMICGIYAQHILERIGEFELSFDHQDIINDGRTYDFFLRTQKPCDVMVTPNYHVKRRRDILSRALRRGAKGIVIQHSEQFFPRLFYEEKLNLGYREAYDHQIGGHLVWGEDFARKLVEQAHVAPQKIYIVGNPKLDLARRLQHLHSIRNISSHPTILVASNFNLGDYSEDRWQRFKRTYSVTTTVDLHHHFRRARTRTIEWVSSAARAHPQVQFLMRTHPGEKADAYESLRTIPNIEISGGTPIGYDLGRADVVLCFTSSSLFEAIALRKPVFSLTVETLPEECRPTYYDDLDWIDREQMNAVVEGLNAGRLPEQSAEFIKSMKRHVWNPQGNTLLTNAIGIHQASSEVMSNGRWSTTDTALGRLYCGVAALKLGAVRLAHLLYTKTGWKNPLYQEMTNRWEERVRMQDFLTDEMVADADRMASQIIGDADYEDLRKGYTLRESDYGYYVELADTGKTNDDPRKRQPVPSLQMNDNA